MNILTNTPLPLDTKQSFKISHTLGFLTSLFIEHKLCRLGSDRIGFFQPDRTGPDRQQTGPDTGPDRSRTGYPVGSY